MSYPLVAARIRPPFVAFALVLLCFCFGSTHDAAEVAEVRQLVTFKFEAGMTNRAVAIFADALLPVYKEMLQRWCVFAAITKPRVLNPWISSS